MLNSVKDYGVRSYTYTKQLCIDTTAPVRNFYNDHQREIDFLASTAVSIGIPVLLGAPLFPIIRGILALGVVNAVANAWAKTNYIKPALEVENVALKAMVQDWFDGKKGSLEALQKHVTEEKERIEKKLLKDVYSPAFMSIGSKVMNNLTVEIKDRVRAQNVKASLHTIITSDDSEAVANALQELSASNDISVANFNRIKQYAAMMNEIESKELSRSSQGMRSKVIPAMLQFLDGDSNGVCKLIELIDVLKAEPYDHSDLVKFINNNEKLFATFTMADLADEAALKGKASNLLETKTLAIRATDAELATFLDAYKNISFKERNDLQKVEQSIAGHATFTQFFGMVIWLIGLFSLSSSFSKIANNLGGEMFDLGSKSTFGLMPSMFLGFVEQVKFDGTLIGMKAFLVSNLFYQSATASASTMASYACPVEHNSSVLESTVLALRGCIAEYIFSKIGNAIGFSVAA